jgi:hypothetical protein
MAHVADNGKIFATNKPSTNPSGANAKEMEWTSKFSKHDTKEVISDIITISKISAKTGIAPNLLKEIYPSQNSSKKCDISKMSQDFSGGKGLEVIKQRAKDFEESKESFSAKYYPNGIESSRENGNVRVVR